MRQAGWIAAASGIIMLAGCSGGGSGPGASVPQVTASATLAPQSSATANVAFAFEIPSHSSAASAARAKPAFVSASTSGVFVQVYASPQNANPNPVATFAIDVSAGSKACAATSGGGRSCSFTLPLAAGTYDIVDTLYDAPPVNGAFASANVLGTGRVTQSVVLHTSNTVTVSIGGVVSSIVLGPARDVAVNTSPTGYTLAVTALDADKNTIVAGTADPYANPITISASDTGAHTTLSLNGGAPVTSVTTTQSSDVVKVAYDGAGPAGYFASFAATANGAAPSSAGFDSFNATLTLVSFLGSGQTQTETIVEPHNTAPFVVTPAANCTGVTTAGPLSGSGSTETFVLSSGVLAQTCYVTAASETGAASVPIKVVNMVPAQLTIPAHRLFAALRTSPASVVAYDVTTGAAVQTITGAATTLMAPSSIARDSSGNIYVVDVTAQAVDLFAPNASGNVAPLSTLTIPGTSPGVNGLPYAVGLDRSNDIFVSALIGAAGAPLFIFGPGASGAATPTAQLGAGCTFGSVITTALAVDPSGQSYTESLCLNGGGAGSVVLTIAPYGATSFTKSLTLPFTSATFGGVALDASDNIYVTDPNGTKFYEYASTAIGTAAPIRTGTGLATPQGIAVGNDGTVYVLTHPGVGNATTTAIAVFAPGATTPTSTFPIATTNVSGSLSL